MEVLCHNFTFQNMEVLCVIYAPLEDSTLTETILMKLVLKVCSNLVQIVRGIRSKNFK
ncbi:unnamed protein product, partial [Nesidiocoris tenuis]